MRACNRLGVLIDLSHLNEQGFWDVAGLSDAPLVATESSVEFAGFVAIASAFYLDFESPLMKNMPDLIREQRASVEDSLEWTVAKRACTDAQ